MSQPDSRRTALVSGAASGIGAACVRELVARGHRVGMVDVDSEKLDQVAAALTPGMVHTIPCDVTDAVSVNAAVADAAGCFGGIDIVVGAAGISGPFGSDISRVSSHDFRRVLEVNVLGQFHLVRASIGHLRRSSAGTIVLIGSDSAFTAAPGMAPYCASKAAVVQFARALAVDLASDGIRVNAVCPSITDTPLARRDLGRIDGFDDEDFPVQSADDVARHVLYLASESSQPINGHALVSDFGFLARSTFPA